MNLSHQDDGSAIADYDYAYDAANRITQIVSPDGTSDFEYNDRNELTGAEYDFQTNEDYTYDETGNRTNPGYETGENNQVLNDGTFTYKYDGEGNRTKRTEIATGEVTEYTWDYRDRLTKIAVLNAAGDVIQGVSYTYDVNDRRIEKTVDANGAAAGGISTERYIHDGDEISLVFDGAGEQLQRYLHGPQIDQVLAQESADGEVQWALADHQGSVRDVVDNDGQVVNHVVYDSFGQITEQSNPTAFFRFSYTGREFDPESEQYYYRARYFDPSVGRFISEDPTEFNAGDVNLSRYVGNNPLNLIDPFGLAAQDCGCARNPINPGQVVTSGIRNAGIGIGLTFGAGLAVGAGIVSAPALITVGAVLFVGNAGLSLFRRSQQAQASGNNNVGEIAAATALDSFGLNGLVEGFRGQELVSGRCLGSGERSDALGSGIGNLATAGLGPRAFGAGSNLGSKIRTDRLIGGLTAQGIKHTPEDIISISKDPAGKTVFLETGNSKAGLTHIIEQHGADFARRGISSEQIPAAVTQAVTKGKIVGYQGRGTARPIYEVKFNNATQRIAVTVGDNGFIVGANPAR